jgi:hypothetical protein
VHGPFSARVVLFRNRSLAFSNSATGVGISYSAVLKVLSPNSRGAFRSLFERCNNSWPVGLRARGRGCLHRLPEGSLRLPP